MIILLILNRLRMKRVSEGDVMGTLPLICWLIGYPTPAFGDFSIGFSFLQVTSAFDMTNFLNWYNPARLVFWIRNLEFALDCNPVLFLVENSEV